MARKFSEVRLDWKIWLYNLLETKIETFNSRLNPNEKHLGKQFSNELFSLFPVERLHRLDLVTREIFNLIGNNPEVEMDDILDSLWQDVWIKYSSIYTTIETFNESRSWVYEITNTNEWRVFVEQGLRQMHQFDRQNNNTWNYEKLTDLETRTYSLLSLIKSAIIESKWLQEESHNMPKSFDEAKKIADLLIKNHELIQSGIESSKSIKTFNVKNIDEALRNIWEMFYQKDMYWIIQKDATIWVKVIEALFLFLDDIRKSPVWWFILGIISLITVFITLILDFITIKDTPELYKDTWQIVLSMHIIWASFIGYLTVFCFSNFKKIEQRHEAYRFRWILTRSFGFLLKSADEEQKKILYPKALDAIFKDLPESNKEQDVNINLPVTEIMKWITWK
jgi:hypothetical protein